MNLPEIINYLTEFFLDFLETIIVSLAIFIVLFVFAIQPHQVSGLSMYPALDDGEYLFTDKLTYRFSNPQNGDIIIFKAPHNEVREYIKRIIALPGDKVRLSKGKVYINGNLSDESAYLAPDVTTSQERYLKEGVEITIPPDSYFVAGDNRPHSSDSRDFGPVPKANIVGKAWLRYWPPQAVGIVDHLQ